jgi:hypothetical protein
VNIIGHDSLRSKFTSLDDSAIEAKGLEQLRCDLESVKQKKYRLQFQEIKNYGL